MSKVYGATSFSLDSIIITNGKIQIEAVKKKKDEARWGGRDPGSGKASGLTFFSPVSQE